MITTPSGLSTGKAGGCINSTCLNAATVVLENTADTPPYRTAQCEPCTRGRIRPPAEIDAMPPTERDWCNPLSDRHWVVRNPTAVEAVELRAIRHGHLVAIYLQRPGAFAWTQPASSQL